MKFYNGSKHKKSNSLQNLNCNYNIYIYNIYVAAILVVTPVLLPHQ